MSEAGGSTAARTGDASRRRRVNRFMVIAVLVVPGLWAAVEAVWAATGRPANRVDHAQELMSLSASLQPPGEDGWTLFVEAAMESQRIIRALQVRNEAALEYSEEGVRTSRPDFGRLLTNPVDERWTYEIDALDQMRAEGVFDTLAAAAACPRAVRPLEPDGEPLFNVLLPELGAARYLAKARVGSMRLALLRDDPEEAVAALGQSMAIARILAAQALLIDRLVSAAIAQLVATELRRCLEEFELDAATAESLLAALDAQRPFAPLRMQIEGERHAALDMIQHVFTDDGHGSGRLRLGDDDGMGWVQIGRPAGPLSQLGMTLHAGRAETEAHVNAYFDGLAAALSRPPATRFAQGTPAMAAPTWRSWVSQVMLPAVSKATGSVDAAEQAIEAARVHVAIEAHIARHGAPPASLEDLTPSILATVPTDPFNGKPFGYRLDADGQPELVSIGLDGIDDSGMEPMDGVASTSDDVVLNAPARAKAQEE